MKKFHQLIGMTKEQAGDFCLVEGKLYRVIVAPFTQSNTRIEVDELFCLLKIEDRDCDEVVLTVLYKEEVHKIGGIRKKDFFHLWFKKV